MEEETKEIPYDINNNNIYMTKIKTISNNNGIIRNVKSIYEEFNLNKIGSIRLAKIHSSANRPLNKIKEFNSQTEFCQCCNMPAEQEGILEKYKFCDKPDNFTDCGEAITFYFLFFEFAIIILIITFLLVCIFNIIYSKKYYEELFALCNKNNLPIEEDCNSFLDETKNNSNSYSLISNSYFYMYNSINVKYYKNFYYKLNNENNTKIDSVVVNTSYMNFICSITLFIINLLFIVIFNSKHQEINCSILSLSDYSIILSNLNYSFKKFLKIKKEINLNKDKAEKNNEKYNYNEELNKHLGIDQSLIDLPELEQFVYFLKNKICVGHNEKVFNIKKVNICCKISKLMTLEEELDKIEEKISKIKNHPYQIMKNEENKFKGEKRKYYSSIFDYMNIHCCEKIEELKELNDKEEKLNSQIKQLIEQSLENTTEYFSGCIIISLDNINEQEQLLEINSNKTIISYIIKLLVYYFCEYCLSKNKKRIDWLKRNIRFKRAPEPEDILFENLEYMTSISRYIRTFLVHLFSLILIFICFIIVTLFNHLQKYIDDNNNFHIVVAYIISLLISLSIFIINYFFQKMLDYLTKREKQSTTTNYFLSKSIKLTIFSFMNYGIVPLISELYVKTKGYEYLIINMLMIFLINSFLVPISWTINFSYFYKKFRIWLIERKKGPFEEDINQEKTQKELNELYELPSMNISEKYSYIFNTF